MMPEGYEAQCRRMVEAGRAWREAHSDPVLVEFPKEVALICVFEEAERLGLHLNEAARELVTAMEKAEPDPNRAPTVLMVRVCLDEVLR